MIVYKNKQLNCVACNLSFWNLQFLFICVYNIVNRYCPTSDSGLGFAFSLFLLSVGDTGKRIYKV